jgi:hypothetical protein
MIHERAANVLFLLGVHVKIPVSKVYLSIFITQTRQTANKIVYGLQYQDANRHTKPGVGKLHSDGEEVLPFYGTEKFITVFTKVTTGPYPEQNQSEYRLIQLEMLCDVR